MVYRKADLLDAYKKIGVTPGRVIYVTSDLGLLGAFETNDREAVLEAHFEALSEAVGPTGTIVVPTNTMNLCNTDTVFDPDSTPSYKCGILSEHIRQKPGAKRSFHPFASYTALGPRAEEITGNVSRHSYGMETPESRLIEADGMSVSIGMPPNRTCSTVHHVEMVMGVPYRYVKEFVHPVVRDGAVREELFYQNVWYREIGLKRDKNARLFASLPSEFDLRKAPVGRAAVCGYDLRSFYEVAVKIFSRDIYIWCVTPPTIRPYRQ